MFSPSSPGPAADDDPEQQLHEQQHTSSGCSGAVPASSVSGESRHALLPKPPSSERDGLLLLQQQQAQLPYTHPLSVWTRRYMLALLASILALLSADQNLLAPNLSEAAAFFNLDDAAKDRVLGGWVAGVFFLVGAPAALVCGYLADKVNRIHLLAFVVLLGEAPCLATYWVTSLWQFFVLRTLTGISVGGSLPLLFSLLGDLAPPSSRAALAAALQVAIGGGIGAGQAVAGLVGPATNWRVPFAVVAAPALVLVLLLLATVREPPRGGFEAALQGDLAAGVSYTATLPLREAWRLLRVPSNWLLVLQGIPGCLPWGVLQTYITDYLHVSKGLSIQMATTVLLAFSVGCGVGVVGGGAAGQALYNRRKEAMALLVGGCVLLGATPVLFLINADLQTVGMGGMLAAAAAAGLLVSVAGPNVRAVVLNVNPPEARGLALALQAVTDDLGKGAGPLVVAAFISRLGRTAAFNLALAGWVPCGLLLGSLVFTMRADEDAMQAGLRRGSSVAGSALELEDPSQQHQPPPGGPAGALQVPTSPGSPPGHDARGGGGGGRGVKRALLRTIRPGSSSSHGGQQLQRNTAIDSSSSSSSRQPLLAVCGLNSVVTPPAGGPAAGQGASMSPCEQQAVAVLVERPGSLELQELLAADSQPHQQPSPPQHAGFARSSSSELAALHVLQTGAAHVSAAGTRHRSAAAAAAGHHRPPRHRSRDRSSSSRCSNGSGGGGATGSSNSGCGGSGSGLAGRAGDRGVEAC